MAIIYDADIRYLLFLLLKRVWTEMINYKKLIRENNEIYMKLMIFLLVQLIKIYFVNIRMKSL